jgi:hypothetical protein
MNKEKELFTYCPKANAAAKELDKYDLKDLLSKLNGSSLQRIQSHISDEYPQLEKHLDLLEDGEFMMYFETRYGVVFTETSTYHLRILKEN